MGILLFICRRHKTPVGAKSPFGIRGQNRRFAAAGSVRDAGRNTNDSQHYFMGYGNEKQSFVLQYGSRGFAGRRMFLRERGVLGNQHLIF